LSAIRKTINVFHVGEGLDGGAPLKGRAVEINVTPNSGGGLSGEILRNEKNWCPRKLIERLRTYKGNEKLIVMCL